MDNGLGVYIHWPFCAAKCPYCDFNSHVVRYVDHARWAAAICAEIRRYSEELPERNVETVFLGGGTPSLMEPATVATILDEIARCWPVAEDAEVTLEANPTSTESAKFLGFARAGVNRLSMGVQALDDQALQRLGRQHSAEEAIAAFDIARRHFARVSFDLIYARQDQTLKAWEAELTQAISMAVDHLSLYQLTIEPETRFGALYARGKLRGLPSDDLGADFYDLTQDVTTAAGLPAYEISNHARPSAQSRHNMIYWQYRDYIGIGPGAHGRFVSRETKWATEAERMPAKWLDMAEQSGAEVARLSIDPQQQAEERLMMGLRLTEGIPFTPVATYLQTENLQDLLAGGWLQQREGYLRATDKGRLVLNTLIEKLIA